jgi:integrase
LQLIYTWDDATARWLQEKASKQSLATDIVLIRWLDSHLSGVPLQDIDRSVVSSLAHKKIATGVTNATVNRMLSFLRALLNMAAVDWDWLPSSPKVRLLREPTRRIRYLKKTEAVRLLRELPEHLSAMAAFSLATGLRRANVTGLEWSQVDMSRQLAWIHADQAKAGRSLAVPLNTDAMRVLLTRVGRHPKYVFSYQGERVTQVSTAAWYKALKRAGISDFRWHDLRHTWASWHVQNGTPLFALQELGGWGSTEMVRRYAHFSVGNLVSYASNLPTFSGP